MALTKEQVAEHILRSGSVAMVELATLLGDTAESCVDGRGRVGVIGTPGGNIGELVLALTAAENVARRPVNDDLIVVSEGGMTIFKRCLEAFGRMYMHSDAHALAHLGLDEATLRTSPHSARQRLLFQLIQPDNIGCGHLRLMVQNPDAYHVRRSLVAALIEAFYTRLWQGDDRLDFVVLRGEHQEGAVVNIVIDDANISARTMIPTVSPMLDGEQMFVNHPQASWFLRVESAHYIGNVVGFAVDRDPYLEEIRRLGDLQLKETLTRLAPGLPVYNAYFRNGQLDRVEVA